MTAGELERQAEAKIKEQEDEAIVNRATALLNEVRKYKQVHDNRLADYKLFTSATRKKQLKEIYGR